MRKLIIMRGLPGSGKTTLAEEICYHIIHDTNAFVTIRSTDSKFLDSEGNYKFDPSKLGINHVQNQNEVREDMDSGAEMIIVDNTNMTRWEMKPYIDLANRYGYDVEERIVGKFDDESIALYAQRNQHGVPIEAIRRMAKKFEA